MKILWNLFWGIWRYGWIPCWVCDGGKITRHEWLPKVGWFHKDDPPTLPAYEKVPRRCGLCGGSGRERVLLDRSGNEVHET